MTAAMKIVVPTDFSDASLTALDWIRTFADGKPVEVHCITVVQQPTMYFPTMAGTSMEFLPGVDDISKLSEDSLGKVIDRHKDQFDQPPVTKVLVGRPADEIVEYSNDIDAEMIVIAARGHSQLAHLMLGDTAAGVVRQAKCPVVTIKS
jgi:universal stress protein A